MPPTDRNGLHGCIMRLIYDHLVAKFFKLAAPAPIDVGRPLSVNRGDSIHDLVEATFSRLEMPAPTEVWETLLIMDGCFIGRKYHCAGGYALWAPGWDAIEFYDDSGKYLMRVAVKKPPLRSSTPAA